MSDQRPEWMEAGSRRIFAQSLDWRDDELDKVLYRTGLRAQVAVLEEMQSAGEQHYDGHPYTVEFQWIGRKIAALRKELGQ